MPVRPNYPQFLLGPKTEQVASYDYAICDMDSDTFFAYQGAYTTISILFSRGGKCREIPTAVDIYFVGGKFRAKSKFANIAKISSTRKIRVIQYADSKMPPGAYLFLRNTHTGHGRTPYADMPRTMGHVRTRTYFYISPNIFYFWWKLLL